jgi:AraC-like DNA-binding protein
MQREAPTMERRSVSDMLSGLTLTGQSWCYSDIAEQSGFSVAPGDGVTCHVVLHGTVRIACAGGEMRQLAAGDIIIVVSGEAHAVRTCVGAPAATHAFLREVPAIDVPPTIAIGAGRTAARLLSGRMSVNWPGGIDRGALPSLLSLADGPGAQLVRPEGFALAGIGAGAAALLTGLAALLLVAGLRADPRCRHIFAPARHDPIGDALRLIEARPATDWTVERLARAVGMGRSNFAAHFTQEIGRAPMEVVAEARMRCAAQMLRADLHSGGGLKVAEIGETVGYGSEAAFSRRFTRHFGVTPSRMREEARALAREAPPPEPKRLLLGRMAKPQSALAGTSAAGASGRPQLLIGARRGGAKP